MIASIKKMAKSGEQVTKSALKKMMGDAVKAGTKAAGKSVGVVDWYPGLLVLEIFEDTAAKMNADEQEATSERALVNEAFKKCMGKCKSHGITWTNTNWNDPDPYTGLYPWGTPLPGDWCGPFLPPRPRDVPGRTGNR